MSDLNSMVLSEWEFYQDMPNRLGREALEERQIFPWRAHNTMPDDQPDMFGQFPFEIETLLRDGDLVVAQGILHFTHSSSRPAKLSVRSDKFCQPTGNKILESYFAGPDSMHARSDLIVGLGLRVPG